MRRVYSWCSTCMYMRAKRPSSLYDSRLVPEQSIRGTGLRHGRHGAAKEKKKGDERSDRRGVDCDEEKLSGDKGKRIRTRAGTEAGRGHFGGEMKGTLSAVGMRRGKGLMDRMGRCRQGMSEDREVMRVIRSSRSLMDHELAPPPSHRALGPRRSWRRGKESGRWDLGYEAADVISLEFCVTVTAPGRTR